MTKKSVARLQRDTKHGVRVDMGDHWSDALAYGSLMHEAIEDGGGSSKKETLAFLYGGGLSARREIAAIRNDTARRLEAAMEHQRNLERIMKLSKQNFDRLAVMTREIDASLAAETTLCEEGREQVMNVVRARIAMVCAEGNPAFDSFRFDAACKGTRA